MQYKIKSEKIVFDDFLTIREAEIVHDQFNGKSIQKKRKAICRGDAVAILLYETDTDNLLFTHQFRYPTIQEKGWMVEVAAGMVEDDEPPEEAIRREVKEEIGYQINQLEFINSFYLSPGISTERIFLYFSEVRSTDKIFSGGGSKSEKENIELIKMRPAETFEKLASNEIRDAKTVIAIQWFINLKA